MDPLQPALHGDFVRLAVAFEGLLDALSAETVERLRQALPIWLLEEVVEEREIERFVRSSLSSQLRCFHHRFLPDCSPPVDAWGAQLAARSGELKALLAGYRIAHMVLWNSWLELVEDSGVEEQIRRGLLRYGSLFFFRYAGVLSDFVSETYQDDLEKAMRSGEQRRFRAVKGLLEGRSSLGVEFGLNLDQHHLSLIAWEKGGEAAARGLAKTLGRPLLSVSPAENVWWCWISGAHPLSAESEKRLEAHRPPPGAALAVGLEAFGEDGFRATHRQAQRARRVARRRGLDWVLFANVAVEALLGDDPADARAFVAHELRGIDDDSVASRRIRETIAAYFAAEHNAASAAAALGIHQQTVANRLRAAEERLGHPVASRRVELETAMRLR
ncbi:MAG TPA: helix-turn-helix domain-containing protein, partial [Solirubrobacterales bacterium]